MNTPRRRNGRPIVLAGFGGLLTLLLFAAADAFIVMREVQMTQSQVRDVYLRRTQALERIRTGILQSAVSIRDFLLADNDAEAGSDAQVWREVRDRTDRTMEATVPVLDESAVPLFRQLQGQVHAYWAFFESILQWNAEQRRSSPQLSNRRAALLALIDRIDEMNRLELASGENKAESEFRRLRLRLLVTLSITLALGVILAIFSIRRMLSLESALRMRLRESAASRHALQDLSARLVSAQEEERRAIARELHDEVGQSLSALLMEAGSASASISRDEPETRRHVESIRRLAEASVQVIRNMTLLLRPSMLDDLGLVPALEWQAREVSKRTGLRVQVAADETASDLSDDHKTCIYRVVQEALNNCARHAQARNVTVQVRLENSGITLTVKDDGHGFDTQRVRGLGLLGMEERVTHLGGVFRIESAPNHGTTVRVELPQSAAQAPAQEVELDYAHDTNSAR